ncbi:MAG: LysR family transcriptional regulator [Firmicutes bacterium]|nr:LysR family transcriptional regulator [Bacillota bacterium]
MDLRILRTFIVAARLQNFRRAAERLYLAQPTVTAHIRQLEAELGYPLFERAGRRVRLTAAGERFLPHAERVLREYEAGLQALVSWGQGYRSRLAVAASPLVARSVLPRVVKRFMERHPDVEVSVAVLSSDEVGPAVAQGRADIGFSRQPPGERDLAAAPLYEDPVVLVAPADAGDLDSPPPDWRELLEGQRLLTHNHPLYWDDLLLELRSRGLRVRTMAVTQVDITKRFIEEGLGVSFLPLSTVWRELCEGRLMEVPTPGLRLPVARTYLVYNPRRAGRDPARSFIDLTRDLFAAPG